MRHIGRRGPGKEGEGAAWVSQCNDSQGLHAMLWYSANGTRIKLSSGVDQAMAYF